MRAINLVPADERVGRVNGGKSNGAVYGVLVGLIVVLVGIAIAFEAEDIAGIARTLRRDWSPSMRTLARRLGMQPTCCGA